MKCLENLALVDDACMEELQKDIGELIVSYLKVNQICCDMLDKIEEKDPGRYRISTLNKIFDKISKEEFSESCFYGLPQYIESFDELVKWIENDQGCVKDSVETAILLTVTEEEKINKIIEKTEGFWIYREGTNWEIYVHTTKELIDYLKCVTDCIDEKENQILLLRELKEYMKYWN